MTKPRVSVLMPAYNASSYIGEAIQSIINQSYKDWELIIADDASTDSTPSILADWEKKDRRIRVLHNTTNLNISKNRNKLISHAKGEYIAWQDADDVSLTHRLERQVDYMENHPEVGICGGYLELFTGNRILGVRRYPENDAELRQLVFRYAVVSQPAAIIRRKCFEELGDFDPTIPLSQAEDLDMALRIGSRYKFANLQERVIRYRVHPASATFKKQRQMEINTIVIRRKYADGYGYSMSVWDKIYNVAQYLSIFIIPPKIKIWLFSLIRDSKGE